MENHTSASMYIPSSRVLARLQRHSTATPTTAATSTLAPSTMVSTASPAPTHTTSERGASTSSGDDVNGAAARSRCAAVVNARETTPVCSRADSTAAAAATDSASQNTAPLGKPYYPSHPHAASSAKKGTLSAAATSAEAARSSSGAAAASPQTKEVDQDAPRPAQGAPTVPRTEHTGVSTCPRTCRQESADMPRSASASASWLLPRADVAYIFSTLTWNVDLLRLLLPHAPCPLRLPTSESLPSTSRGFHGEAAATLTTPVMTSADAVRDAVSACRGSREESGALPVRQAALQCPNVSAAAVDAAGTAGVEKERLRNEEREVPYISGTAGAEKLDATAGSSMDCSVRVLCPADRPLPSPPVTPRLTWSQHLFGGSHQPQQPSGSTPPCLPPASASAVTVTPAPALALSSSPGDVALTKQAATAAAAGNSIFNAHYLPSLEEFQRDLEAQRQQQQQLQQQHQQQQSSLSATRLEQHLQQQQLLQPRRHAMTNRTFFYSPTPSVASLATTFNAVLEDEGDDGAASPLQSSRSRSTLAGLPLRGGRSYARAVIATASAAAASARSSPAPSVSTVATSPSVLLTSRRSQHVSCGPPFTRRRHRVSSTTSLEAVGDSVVPHAVSPARFPATSSGGGVSLSASLSSRPSLLQAQQQPPQPSMMMMRAADRLRASIVTSIRNSPCPAATTSTRQHPDTNTVASINNSNGSNVCGGGGVSGSVGQRVLKGRSRDNGKAETDSNRTNTSSSDEESEGGVQWLHSRASSVTPSSSSTPGSPVASMSSMSFAKMWSSAVSGRATPRSSMGGAAMGGNSFNACLSGDAFLTMSASGVSVGGGCGGGLGGGSRRRKKNLRRQRSARTRRQRAMRVYVPSITEGPKAATLYTAPTAEAQELLLQLQRREAVSAGNGGATRTPHLPAAPMGSHVVSGQATSASLRSISSSSVGNGAAPTSANPQLQYQPVRAATAQLSRPDAHAGEGSLSTRSGNEQHAIHSSLLHASTEDVHTSDPKVLHQQQQHDAVQSGNGSGEREQNYVTYNSSYLAAALGSQSPILASHPASQDGSLTAGSASLSGAHLAVSRPDTRESGEECCDRASLDSDSGGGVPFIRTLATPVELPSWVRERSLSALYYQPWGLELLARYEQQQQLRRVHIQQQPQRRPPNAALTPPTSPPQRATDCEMLRRHTGSAPSCATASTHAPPAAKPNLSASFAGPALDGADTSGTMVAAAPRRPPVLARASLGTTAAAAAGGATQPATSRASAPATPAAAVTNMTPTAAASAQRVSWAAALRHHPDGPPTTSRITATTTMTNATTATTSSSVGTTPRIDQQSGVHAFGAVPEWPPELAAAEERDAQEEAFYFRGLSPAPLHPSSAALTSSPSPSALQSRKGGREEGGGTTAAATAVSSASAAAHRRNLGGGNDGGTSAHHPHRGYEWDSGDLLNLPTLYLSRQKRSRRRLRAACPEDATTTRSSTARRGSSTSAAAELHNKRASARAAAAEAAAAASSSTTTNADANKEAEDGSGSGLLRGVERTSPSPTTTTTTTSSSKEDLFLFGDAYRRKKTAQLYYPPPPASKAWTAPRKGHATAAVAAPAGATPLHASSSFAEAVHHANIPVSSAEAEEKEEGMPCVMWEHRVAVSDTTPPTAIAGAAARALPLSAPRFSPAQQDEEQQQQQHQQQCRPAPTPSASTTAAATMACREPPKEAAAADEASAAPAAKIAATSASHTHPQQQQTAATPTVVPEVDINFFLQKFLRAVLIIVVTQVRLHQQQQQQHTLPCPLQSREAVPGTFEENGEGKGSGSGGGVLSAEERHALAFVRHHMPHYRSIMTTYVMRDEKEVARRSAQSIFAGGDPPGAAAAAAAVSEARGAQQTDSGDAARCGACLFDHRVCHACLCASRVNKVYAAAVAADGDGNDHDDSFAGTSSLLDDVEAMYTTQVYISGKDAAWQPLLMELLQVSRVVQCYGDGPVSLATATAASNTPQQHLLESLEAFVAQPTLPLLRATMVADTTLSPLQAAAAAEMTEVSDAFRRYLLAGYLTDPAARNTAALAKGPTASLSHPQRQERACRSQLLQPLSWYPYAYMPGTASPYAENTDPTRTAIPPAQAAASSAMSLFVTTLPLSGRLLWKWVIPAEDTDTFNLSVFFQSSLFSFMQGGALPMPTSLHAVSGAVGPLAGPPQPPMHPSALWPPALAAAIDARLHADAWRNAWDGEGTASSPCTCSPSLISPLDGDADGKAVLVHCSAGMHRSCGILVAFLLWLLYQCRQVVRAEQRLGWRRAGDGSGGGEAPESALLSPVLDEGEDEERGAFVACTSASSSPSTHVAAALVCGVGEVAVAPTAGDPIVTSRQLRQCIHHVQLRRSIAVPIRTVQCLLQSFANELQLS